MGGYKLLLIEEHWGHGDDEVGDVNEDEGGGEGGDDEDGDVDEDERW